jgi:hypothetical protein
MAQKSYRSTVAALVFSVIFLIVVGIPSYFAADAFNIKDKLENALRNSDQQAVKKELYNLKYYSGLSKKLKLSWLADRYLLNDAVLYEAAYQMIIGDNKEAVRMLEDMKNDYRANHMMGIAKFRDIRAQYREAIKTAKSKESKVAVAKLFADRLVNEVAPDFESAVRNSPEFVYPDPNFDDRYNYDLIADEASAMSALESQGPPQRVILKQEGDQTGGKNPKNGKRGNGPQNLDEKRQPGGGSDLKRKG